MHFGKINQPILARKTVSNFKNSHLSRDVTRGTNRNSRFKSSFLTKKHCISANAAIVDKKTHISMLYIVLKKFNRLDKFRCQKMTDQIQEAMQKVDSIHLKLQNLHYETVHLKKEITKCLEFKSLDEEINLVPLKEFYKEAPENITQSIETQSDGHKLTLARLQWELQQRKELAKKLSDSQKKQEKVLEEISKKQSYLENLRPTLKSILKAAQPLQDELGVPLLASESFHNMAKHLPQPLCVLFIQSSAYHEACDKRMTVEVQGDVNEAITWKDSEDILEEDSDSDAEDDGKRKRRHRKNSQNKNEIRKKKLLQKHPLHVKITISLSDSESIELLFYYLVSLHIVTVDVSVHLTSLTSTIKPGDVLSSSSVLNCVFPLDTGNETPNPTNHFQLEKVGMGKFSDYIAELGFPYRWAQRICGLNFEAMIDDSSDKDKKSKDILHSLSSKNIEVTISSIRSRLRSRLALHQQLIALEKGSIAISKTCAHLFCPKIMSRLTSWKSVNWNELNALSWTAELLEAGIIDNSDIIYCATLERSSAKMTAYVLVSQDYPKITPFFKLDIIYRGKHSSSNDVHVRDMEQEMNIYTQEFLEDDSSDQILVNLIEKLRMCFDIYLETAAMIVSDISEGPCEFPKEKVFIQSSRGKDHCRPYKFLPKIGVFSHR
ncbi:THO complex subunit 5 [Nymphon striatum]|nr:THO complex subunit 5 [Nymphon striatum]